MRRGRQRDRQPASTAAALLAAWLILPLSALGQAASVPQPPPVSDEAAEEYRPKLVFLPFVYYTPETKLALGAGGVLTFRAGADKARTRSSAVWLMGSYSLARQFQVSVNPQIFFEGNGFAASGLFRYERTPQKFYGIGNDTDADLVESYTPRVALAQVGLKRRVWKAFYAGALLDLERTSMEKTEPGGLLETSGIAGSLGGLVAGLGISFDWDTRDSTQFPRKGAFLQLQGTAYGAYLGGDFSFGSLKLDARSYSSSVSGRVLALQTVVRLTTGDPPFYRLAMLGGDSLLRGYYKGRFRDKDLVVVQAEYRVPLGGRFGAVGFAGLGQVFPRLSEFALKGFKHSLGAGLRYSLNPREGTNVRMDLAWGARSFGLYFTAQESF